MMFSRHSAGHFPPLPLWDVLFWGGDLRDPAGTRRTKASRRRQELQAEMDAQIEKERGDLPQTTKKHYILGKD